MRLDSKFSKEIEKIYLIKTSGIKVNIEIGKDAIGKFFVMKKGVHK